MHVGHQCRIALKDYIAMPKANMYQSIHTYWTRESVEVQNSDPWDAPSRRIWGGGSLGL